MSDDGQKQLYLRAGVLSADVKKQPTHTPMIIVTPTARFVSIGTRLDVMATPERSKLSVREGLVQAIRLADGKSVNIASGNSAIASTESNSKFSSRRSDQTVHVWKANLERDHRPGEGEYISAMLALRLEIRDALQNEQVDRDQIREEYGARLAGKDGTLRAKPKQVMGSPFGNVIQIATLYVNHDKPNPVVLQRESLFRVQVRVATATKLNFGVGALGTTRANAGRFRASREVAGYFDVKIPVSELQLLRGRGKNIEATGKEVFACFCLTSDRNAQLEISAVELMTTPSTPKTADPEAIPATE
ncbi:MAG: FecR domain-containing protein [Rubripirellula sp.]|nr:FecR domain-containing protein [Rubripirellula sp.]